MNVQLILLTHEHVGECLLKTASTLLNSSLEQIECLCAPYDCNPQRVFSQLKSLIDHNYAGKDILVLTDIFGATPCNIAQHLNAYPHVKIISGLNLPMLIRTLNYADLNLECLCEKALSGGHDGIMMLQQSQQ